MAGRDARPTAGPDDFYCTTGLKPVPQRSGVKLPLFKLNRN
jgi:hypothetical protein